MGCQSSWPTTPATPLRLLLAPPITSAQESEPDQLTSLQALAPAPSKLAAETSPATRCVTSVWTSATPAASHRKTTTWTRRYTRISTNERILKRPQRADIKRLKRDL